MKRFPKALAIILISILLLLSLMIVHRHFREPFDFKAFDQKHHTTFENSGYRYSYGTVPKVYLFRGVPDGLGYSTVTVYDTDYAEVGTNVPVFELLAESEYTVLSFPSSVMLYRRSYDESETYHPSFKVHFSREGCFYVLWIDANDIYTKDNAVIDDNDIAYIERYLLEIFP